MNLILIGPPASGKSTLGRRVAARMKRAWIDSDLLIESLHGKGLSCREIFRQEGSKRFRELEGAALYELSAARGSILSLGGGILETPLHRGLIKALGSCFYLKCSSFTLYKRLIERGLPPYLDQARPEESFRELLERRRPLFEEAADRIVEVEGLAFEEAAETLRLSFERRLREHPEEFN